MIHIVVKRHAYDRMKERLGLNKNAAEKMAELAYENGIDHSDTKGRLHKYIASQTNAYMKKGHCIKIYGEVLYCFVNGKSNREGNMTVSLLTVWVMPNNLKNQILGAQQKKKDRRKAVEMFADNSGVYPEGD